ncbi:MAG: mandelate racemase/muconate lactonizing enzyme family protein [Candidatus Dormibacteraceae bacterium]
MESSQDSSRALEQGAQTNRSGELIVHSVDTFLVNAQWRNFLFVKITTTNGIVGWGEGTLGWKEFAVERLIREFSDRYVIGMDAFRIEDLWFKLYQIEHNLGPVMYSAMAGLETALWDVVGKFCGQPVVNLVGGKVRDRVKAYANGWYGDVQDLDRLRKQAERVVSMGYLALKLDPFGAGGRELTKSELRRARETVAAVRDVVGPDIDILIECHGRFSVGVALEAIRAIKEYEPLFFEEPIPAGNMDSQAWVTHAASALGARVATGEHTYARFGFEALLSRQAAHVIQPDLVYSGGFMETKKIAAMAEAHYVSVAPHNCDGPGKLACSVQLCANIPNFLILESFATSTFPGGVSSQLVARSLKLATTRSLHHPDGDLRLTKRSLASTQEVLMPISICSATAGRN